MTPRTLCTLWIKTGLFLMALLLASGCGRDSLSRSSSEGEAWALPEEVGEFVFDPTGPVAALAAIEISPDEVVLPLAGSRNVSLSARYEDESVADVSAQATWSLDDESVARLEGARVLAVSQGKTLLRADYQGMRATIPVEVRGRRIDEVRIAPRSAEIRPQGKLRLRAWGKYEDGAEEDISRIVDWVTQDDAIAVVSNEAQSEGEVLGLAPGRVQISARIGSVESASTITVAETSELVQLALSPPSAQMFIDSRQRFEVLGVYTDGSGADVTSQVAWSVEPEGFISIEQSGLATGVLPGAGELVARWRGLEARAPITVLNELIQTIEVSPVNATVGRGGQQQFRAEGITAAGARHDLTGFALWRTSDGQIATVDGSGMAVAYEPGLALISAEFHGARGEARFNITTAPVTSLTIEPFAPVLGPQVQQQLRAMARYADGRISEVSRAAQWSSSNEDVARVEGDGWLTARDFGTSVIMAEYEGLRATTSITVTDAALTRVAIEPASLELYPGQRAPLTATGLWSDGTRHDITASVVWTSSDVAVGVSNQRGSAGEVHALKLGGATITAALGATTGEAVVAVTDRRLVEIELEPAQVSMPAGTSTRIEATGIFADGSERDITQQATWSSQNSLLVHARNALGERGVLESLNPGSTSVVASLAGVSASLPVQVTTGEVLSLSITPAAPVVNTNATLQLGLMATYADGASVDVRAQGMWQSADVEVVRVFNSPDVRGTLLGMAPGQAEVRAQFGGLTATAQVSVAGAQINRLIVTPRLSTTPGGQTRQFTAMAIFEDNTTRNVTAQAQWLSADEAIVRMDAQGVMSAISKGETSVSASYRGLTTQAQVTVNGAELLEIQVTPQTPEVAVDTIMRFFATAIYSDGTREDVSEGVSWDTGDQSIMSIFLHPRWQGIAIANAPGVTQISAQYQGVTGSTPVTVTDAQIVELKVAPLNLTVAPGTELQYFATAIFDDGTSRDVTYLCNWTTTNTSSADILEGWRDRGKVIARREGVAQIRAGYQNTVGTAELTVTGATISHVQVIPFTPTVNEGDQMLFWATAFYTDGTTKQIREEALWQSSDPMVAAISNSRWQEGLATTQSPGTTRILATYQGVTGETLLTVTGLQISQIQVTPFVEIIPTGYYLRMLATAIYTNGQARDITGLATWTSSDPMIADVYASFWVKGWALGISPGTAFIQATYQGATGQARVTVTDATIASIELDPPVATALPLEKVEFEATGLFTDGTMREVTHYVTWTSTDQSVADVSNAWISRGEATAFMPGVTDIVATQGNVSGGAQLTVSPP